MLFLACVGCANFSLKKPELTEKNQEEKNKKKTQETKIVRVKIQGMT
jgi:hypothetical protein